MAKKHIVRMAGKAEAFLLHLVTHDDLDAHLSALVELILQ
jgi:hypothetical protein